MTVEAGELQERLAVIEREAAATFGTNEIEHLLYDLLKFLQRNLEKRAEFEPILFDLLERNPDGTSEIISFTMHSLRWESVKDYVEQVRDRDVEPSPPRAELRRRNYDRLLTSFDDDWDEADLYEYYRTPEMFE
jgi:hypothetical protein